MALEDFGQHAKDISKDVARGISTSLMQSSFEKMGEAFTDTGDVRRDIASREGRLQPWREAGAKAAGALEMRWHKEELKQFKQDFIEPWKERNMAVLDEYQSRHKMLDDRLYPAPDGTLIQLDPKKPDDFDKLLRYRGQLETDFHNKLIEMNLGLADAAAEQYPNNPLIGNVVQQMFTGASAMLNNIANPQQTLTGEKGFVDIEATKQQSQAYADQSAAAARGAGAKTKRPTSIEEAVADPSVGIQGVVPWLMGSPEGQKLLNSEQGKAAMLEAETRFREQERAKGRAPVEIDTMIEQNKTQLTQLAAGLYLSAANPGIAAGAEQYSPYAFPEPPSRKTPGIVNRNVPGELVDHNKMMWKDAAMQKAEEIVANSENPPTLQELLDFVTNDWAPRAITGQTEDDIDPSITASSGKLTEDYRNTILKELSDHLRKRWHTSELLSRIYKEDVKKLPPQGRLAKRARMMGLLP